MLDKNKGKNLEIRKEISKFLNIPMEKLLDDKTLILSYKRFQQINGFRTE